VQTTAHSLTFRSVYRTDNVKVITELGRFEHLKITHQVDVMYLFQQHQCDVVYNMPCQCQLRVVMQLFRFKLEPISWVFVLTRQRCSLQAGSKCQYLQAEWGKTMRKLLSTAVSLSLIKHTHTSTKCMEWLTPIEYMIPLANVSLFPNSTSTSSAILPRLNPLTHTDHCM